MADSVRFEAAPLDTRARALLVGWLSAWFVAVAALLGWSLAGGSLGALAAAVVLGTVLPLAVLVRLAGLPSGFVLAGDRLVVQRYLLPARPFVLDGHVAVGAGPASDHGSGAEPAPDHGSARPSASPRAGRGPAAWVGAGYGCRWTRVVLEGDHVERVYRAVTDPTRAVRLGTAEGTLLVTPAAPDALARAARAAVRDGGAGG